jgi:hypothetical protein
MSDNGTRHHAIVKPNQANQHLSTTDQAKSGGGEVSGER